VAKAAGSTGPREILPPTTAVSPAERDAKLRQIMPMVGSSLLYREMAKKLGTPVAALSNKINGRPRASAEPELSNEIDHMVSGDSFSIAGQQNEPSIAVHPLNPNIVIVVGHNSSSFSGNSNDCSVYLSFNGGESFFYDDDLPLSTPAPHFCSDPVVRYSPDGLFAYVSWLDIDQTTFNDVGRTARLTGSNPFVSTLTPLFTASASAPNLVDKEWIDVHTFDADGSGAEFLYWTFTFFNGNNCDIWFVRLDNYGAALGSLFAPIAHSGTCGNPALTARVLQGSRPAAGPGSQVIACWYDASPDGWSTGAQTIPPTPPNPVVPLNKFNIACRTSNDRGLTFAGGSDDPETVPGNWIYAAKAVANEVAFYLGPMGGTAFSPFGYFRYSGAQFPAMAIDHLGTAHIAFTHNPSAASRFGNEQGSIGYVKAVPGATTPIYPKWTKTTVATGFGAQFFPAVSAQKVWEAPKPYVYVGYHDAAVSSKLGAGKANLVYEVKYRRSTGGGFAKAVLVTDHASLSDYSFLGDYIDSTANNGIYQIVWTDNRFAANIFQGVSHFFSDRF
jgi:hypothetical protein